MRPTNKRFLDYFGISYFTIISGMMFLSAVYSMPHVYQESMDTLKKRQALCLFIFLEVMVNYFLVLKNRNYFIPQKILHTKQVSTEWTRKTCPSCVHSIPPRAHHCPLCEKCILKRDHHCFFTGTCVGFYNQRYFVVYCFYCTIASLYAVYVNANYLTMVYAQADNSMWNFFPPVTIFKWIFGYVASDMLYHVILTYISAVTSIGAGGIFVWQFTLVLLGCTTYELWRTKGALFKRCSLGHFKSVFGPLWLLNFILPLPCLRQPGNGIDWGDPKYV